MHEERNADERAEAEAQAERMGTPESLPDLESITSSSSDGQPDIIVSCASGPRFSDEQRWARERNPPPRKQQIMENVEPKTVQDLLALLDAIEHSESDSAALWMESTLEAVELSLWTSCSDANRAALAALQKTFKLNETWLRVTVQQLKHASPDHNLTDNLSDHLGSDIPLKTFGLKWKPKKKPRP